MDSNQSLKLYNLFLPLVKEEAKAKELVVAVEQVIDQKFDSQKDRLATKEDVYRVELQLANNKADILKWLIVIFLPFYIGMIVFLVKQFM